MHRNRMLGFTLIELLVVIAIISILMALLLPAVGAIRESARGVSCKNNLRQLGMGLQSHLSSRGSFPPCSVNLTVVHSWVPYILPFVEEANLYHQYDLHQDWNHPTNRTAIATPIRILNCPSTPLDSNRTDDFFAGFVTAISDYAPIPVVAGTIYSSGYAPAPNSSKGAMHYNEWVRGKDILDGHSHTVLLTEDAGRPLFYIRSGLGPEDNDPGGGNVAVIDGRVYGAGWADSSNPIPLHGFTFDGLAAGGRCAINCTNNNETFSFHPGGVNSLFCDGSVHFLSETIDIGIYAELITRAGGEIPSATDWR